MRVYRVSADTKEAEIILLEIVFGQQNVFPIEIYVPEDALERAKEAIVSVPIDDDFEEADEEGTDMDEGSAGQEETKTIMSNIVEVNGLKIGQGMPKICIPVVAENIEEIKKQAGGHHVYACRHS